MTSKDIICDNVFDVEEQEGAYFALLSRAEKIEKVYDNLSCCEKSRIYLEYFMQNRDELFDHVNDLDVIAAMFEDGGCLVSVMDKIEDDTELIQRKINDFFDGDTPVYMQVAA